MHLELALPRNCPGDEHQACIACHRFTERAPPNVWSMETIGTKTGAVAIAGLTLGGTRLS
jgi:hypothetical protein